MLHFYLWLYTYTSHSTALLKIGWFFKHHKYFMFTQTSAKLFQLTFYFLHFHKMLQLLFFKWITVISVLTARSLTFGREYCYNVQSIMVLLFTRTVKTSVTPNLPHLEKSHAVMEWAGCMICIVSCCRSVKFCVLASQVL